MGPKEDRINEVSIHLSTFTYRLRIAQALMEEHNRSLSTSQATRYIEVLVRDLLEAAEDAQTFIFALTATLPPEAEARLGKEQLRRDGE